MAKQALITLYPTFGEPETVLAREATPEQLYDAWDAWRAHQFKYKEDYKAVQAAKAEIRKIRNELMRRRLPMDRLLWKKEQES